MLSETNGIDIYVEGVGLLSGTDCLPEILYSSPADVL